MSKENGKGGKTAGAVGAVAVVAALALLFGSGKLGFGSGFGLGNDAEKKPDAAPVSSAAEQAENGGGENDAEAKAVEIRVQGREYNFGNVTYGGEEHPLEELLAALAETDRDAKIELVIEDSATKNAVDDLKAALAGAGFTNVSAND